MILVLGTQGQVGTELAKILKAQGRPYATLGLPELDFSRPETLIPLIQKTTEKARLTAVINAAAYTAVDQAEKESVPAFKINAEAPGLLATWCAANGLPFVHYSTDYVYPGNGTRPWSEEDATGPLNVYGRSKLAGEDAVRAAGGSFLIFRTSWVYAAHGKNFVNTMLRLGAEREELQIVRDQVGAPTYAPHLAQATLTALAAAMATPVFPSGVYHACNAGETTWQTFAETIFAEARERGFPLKVKTVHGIPSADYPTPAIRPLNSRLNLLKLKNTFGIEMPAWQIGLRECLEQFMEQFKERLK